MLTVEEIVAMPGLSLEVVGGRGGLARAISWLHVSELEDPTPFLEGGEFLLTTGLGVGEGGAARRAYVRRLAEHGLAGLGFGVGFGYDEVPQELVSEADRCGFPILCVPYDVPFVAITKAAARELASEQLAQLTRALEVHERLARTVVEGQGVDSLLAIVANHLDCSLGLVDETGRVVAEHHARARLSLTGALELPVVFGHGEATLKAARDTQPFGEYDRLVLHHGQTALAFELSRRRAVSAAELRLAGELLDDLERGRLEAGEAARRMAAFGLDPERPYAALLALPGDGDRDAEALRRDLAAALEARGARHLSTVRRGCAHVLVEAASDDAAVALANHLAEVVAGARLAVGRPARGQQLGRSVLEARAALATGRGGVASYRDLGSLELLLGLPDAALEAYVDRVLGAAAANERLFDSLVALLDTGCRWSDAAARLGVHRHTLRYRMDRLREHTGRHPDDPQQRMELWLAVSARRALAARPG